MGNSEHRVLGYLTLSPNEDLGRPGSTFMLAVVK